jgi:4,5:9,10-diseco-3-hydroxy-5,9,17-trioxoandrosta-1(10),2-diene-4-oate hydrolase
MLSAGNEDQLRFVEVEGVKLAYRDVGDGTPILCLHAIGHDGTDYAPLTRGPARVIALDWPGQGASQPDRVPPTARRYALLLAGFVEALGLSQVVLVGNSIGGAAAIRYAAERPDRVRGLVLLNPGGLDSGGWLARLAVRVMVAFFAAGARGRRWFGGVFALYYKLVLRREAAAAARARIVADGYRHAALLRDAWRGFGEPDADLRPLAPRVGCPTLFAWARHDHFVQLRRSRDGIALFPNARLLKFDAGHAPQLETPEQFTAALHAFVSDLA